MFAAPGTLYVYRSYGIHWCANIVVEPPGSAAAVLLRALEPTHGVAAMCARRGTTDLRFLCAGPGRLTQALGITGVDDGASIVEPPFVLEPPSAAASESPSRRESGITKAADLPGATSRPERRGRRDERPQRPTIKVTLRPRPAATPGSGFCSSTDPEAPFS